MDHKLQLVSATLAGVLVTVAELANQGTVRRTGVGPEPGVVGRTRGCVVRHVTHLDIEHKSDRPPLAAKKIAAARFFGGPTPRWGRDLGRSRHDSKGDPEFLGG